MRARAALHRSAWGVDIEERLRDQGGVARRADVVRDKRDRRALADAVAHGRIREVGWGWYALAEVDPAIAVARRFNAAVTCVTAARIYGLPLVTEDRRTHLSVGGGRGCPPAARDRRFVVHRQLTGGPAPGGTLPVASPAEAVAVALRCADPITAVALVDAARHRRLLTLDELYPLLRGPGTVAGRLLLAASSERSRSVAETVARLALRRAGLDVQEGVLIPDVGEVDLLVEGRVVVECDGFAYHGDRAAFGEDRRRDRELHARGFVVLRFTYHDVMTDPDRVIREVRRVLTRVRR